MDILILILFYLWCLVTGVFVGRYVANKSGDWIHLTVAISVNNIINLGIFYLVYTYLL